MSTALNSFKELLIKKAEGNPYLETLIKFAKDEIIADQVIESLLKMAEPSAAMGRGANSALTSYAGHMDNSDVEQIRDALAHHISHYKGALKAGNRSVADQHLNKIIPLMHTAGRAGRHSGGKMVLDYPSTTPWETNYTTPERHPHNGKLKEGTKDLGRRPKKTREGSSRGVPDYRYLEMAPHPGHGDYGKMPHRGGYPFEEIQLGTPAKRDAGKAYLPIEDVGEVNEYVPHPYDQHPIHSVADEAEHWLKPEQKEKFAQELAAWKGSEHHKKWLADQKAKFQKDPEAYKARGSAKPGHVFEGVDLQEPPEHHKIAASMTPAEAPAKVEAVSAAAPKAEASAPAAKVAAAAGAPDITKPPEGSGIKPEHWSAFPEPVRHALHQHYGKGGK